MGFWVLGLWGFRTWGFKFLGLRVRFLGCRAWGLGLGFSVEGFRVKVMLPDRVHMQNHGKAN